MESDRRRAVYSSTGLAIGPAVIETVRLAVAGLSNREIADQRQCSVHTVNNQLKLFYNVARQAIEDETFWREFSTPSKRRQGLPLIWRRMAPILAHLVDDESPALESHHAVGGPADLPAARCRMLRGRDAFIDNVCSTLNNPRAARIVLLAAFGGYGKTECARAIAERMLAEQRFAHLVWIDLNSGQVPVQAGDRPVDTSRRPSLGSVTRTMLSQLSCASEEELRRQLHGEATLVVIDGLESIDQDDRTAVIHALHRWLGNGPSRAMITSRVDVVAPYLERPAFPGLDLPATEELLRGETAQTPQAAQLHNAPASVIERIWQLTLGMPLALHLVIGQSHHYELQQIVTHLEDARAHGSNDEFYAFLCQPAWQELSREAKALLVFMAVATRAPQTSVQLLGITPAAGITFDQATLHHALAELSTWFLVQRAIPQNGDHEPTYTLHPTTRSFVQGAAMRERWTTELGTDEEGMLAAATRKHQDIFELTIGNPTGEAGRYMTMFSQAVLDRTLARSVPDLLHVMRAYQQRGDAARVLWYWESISGYLWYFGRYQEYVECDEYALAAAHQLAVEDPAPGQRLIGIISAELGYAAMELDEPEQANEYYRDAKHVFETLQDMPELVRVLRYQATLRHQQGDFTTAEQLCREALAHVDRIEWRDLPSERDEQAIIRSPLHNLLGAIYHDQQQYDAARREIVLALRIARTISGDHRYWSLPPTLSLGSVHEQLGRLSLAKAYYQRCLKQTEDGNSPDTRADALVRLATLAASENDTSVVRQYAQEAVRLYEAMGKRRATTRTIQTFQTYLAAAG